LGWTTYYGENYPLSEDSDCDIFDPTGSHWAYSNCNDDERVPGWSVFWTDDYLVGRQLNPGRLEILTGGAGGTTALEGVQKAELDSHHRVDENGDRVTNNNVTIAQFIPTCPLADYTLSYAWKSRTDEPNDNTVHVYIDTNEMATHNANSDWKKKTFSFTSGNSGQTLILFGSIGIESTFGMFLDDVSVTPDGDDLENCGPICGDKPKKLTLRYDGADNDNHSQSGNEVMITDPVGAFPDVATIKVYGHKKKNPEHLGTFDRVKGEFFTVSGPRNRIPPRLTFEIYNLGGEGDPIQTVTFHTSCSQILEAGDQFGAITVWSAVN